MVRIGFKSLVRSSNSSPHQDQMKFHKSYICQQRSKKFSNHTSNSHAKFTLQSSFSLFHYQFINETTQPTLQIRGGIHWSKYQPLQYHLVFCNSCNFLPCPLPVLIEPLLSCTAVLYPGYHTVCLLLSKGTGIGQQGSNKHWSLHNGEDAR